MDPSITLNKTESWQRLVRKGEKWTYELTFRDVRDVFKECHIPILVLKGPHLAYTVYEKPEERDFQDLDLLVRPYDFVAAAKILLKKGYSPCKWESRKLASSNDSYNWGFISPLGVMVELHRSLSGYGRFSVDIDALFLEAEHFRWGGEEAMGLGLEDLLTHLCLHIGMSYFIGIDRKHLLDIALLIRKKKVNWERFLNKCRKSRGKTAAFYTLSAVQCHYDTMIPENLMKALEPVGWRKSWLDRWLAPCGFPIYKYPGHHINKVKRRVLLFEMDRLTDSISYLFSFSGVYLRNICLRNRTIRKFWLRRHPLEKWLERKLIS